MNGWPDGSQKASTTIENRPSDANDDPRNEGTRAFAPCGESHSYHQTHSGEPCRRIAETTGEEEDAHEDEPLADGRNDGARTSRSASDIGKTAKL